MNQNQITINLDESTRNAFYKTVGSQGGSPETIARALLYQFSHHAPAFVVKWLSDHQNGTPPNLWQDLEINTRSRFRVSCGPNSHSPPPCAILSP